MLYSIILRHCLIKEQLKIKSSIINTQKCVGRIDHMQQRKNYKYVLKKIFLNSLYYIAGAKDLVRQIDAYISFIPDIGGTSEEQIS